MLTEIGKLFHPLYHALAYLLVFWYGLVPNYAVAISLFTVTVMVVLAPLTVKSTRSMLAMQRLQPEMNALKAKYKNDKMALQTEMSQLFKTNGINPAGGCLPMLIQLPVFIVLYKMIEGLTKTVVVHKVRVVEPQYISHSSLLYKHLIAAHGAMISFGMNLAKAATSSHGSLPAALPFYGLLVVCIGLQFVQMRQLSSRAPKQTGTAAQTQAVMKFMPLIFGFIYLAIPAGVNVYFFVSSLFRIGQQELMYRFDPQVRGHAEAVMREASKTGEKGAVRHGAAKLTEDDTPPVGFLGSLRALRADLAIKTAPNGPAGSNRAPAALRGSRPGTPGATGPRSGQARPPAPRSGQARPPAPRSGQARPPAPRSGMAQGKGARSAPEKNNKPTQIGTARQSPARNGNGSAPVRKPASASLPRPAANQAPHPDPAPSNGRADKALRSGAKGKPTDQPDQSWARRPRPAATLTANGPPASTRPAPPSVEGATRVRGSAEASPNRARAKRARRPR